MNDARLITGFPRLKAAALIAGLGTALSACSGPTPFIENSDKNSGSVTVCYNAGTTTREDVLALVREECKALNEEKTANPRFRYQTSWQCRLFQPVAAYFRCWDDIDPDAKKTRP